MLCTLFALLNTIVKIAEIIIKKIAGKGLVN